MILKKRDFKLNATELEVDNSINIINLCENIMPDSQKLCELRDILLKFYNNLSCNSNRMFHDLAITWCIESQDAYKYGISMLNHIRYMKMQHFKNIKVLTLYAL